MYLNTLFPDKNCEKDDLESKCSTLCFGTKLVLGTIFDCCEALLNLSISCQNELDVYLRLYVLLYADDTIILAETAADLQRALDRLHDYCQKWDLSINVTKTKIVIFSRGKVRNYPHFKIGNDDIEVKDDYVYLGVTFNYNGSFKKAICKQIMQARKAMFAILQKARTLQLPIDIVCELYERCVIPVLLYGSEIWGFENINSLEIFHRSFLRYVLKAYKFTPNVMLYGETNTVDIKTKIDVRMTSFWLKIKYCKKPKFSLIMCSLLSKYHDDTLDEKLKWPSKIKSILDENELTYMWFDPFLKIESSKLLLKQKCNDNFIQRWKEKLAINSQCKVYKLFKQSPKIERYLTDLRNPLLTNFIQFITRVHHLPVTADRFIQNDDPKSKICSKCNLDEIGDESHYLFTCTYFSNDRSKFLSPFLNINVDNISTAWKEILNYSGENLVKVGKFMKIILSNFDFKR